MSTIIAIQAIPYVLSAMALAISCVTYRRSFKTPVVPDQADGDKCEATVATPAEALPPKQCDKCKALVVRYNTSVDGSTICANCEQ